MVHDNGHFVPLSLCRYPCRRECPEKPMKEPELCIADLNGIGPKSQEMLAHAGISTVEHLRRLGAVATYARVRQVCPGVSLNLLWGLESALTGTPWQEVARKYRTSLLLALDEYERTAGLAHRE